MSPRLHDLTGQRFGRLLVLRPHPERVRYGKDKRAVAVLWCCVCVCGEERLVFGSNLRQGFSRSCGCLIRDTTTERNTRHGHARRGNVTRAYTCWVSMLQRCRNPNTKGYCNYGERGITVCEYYCDFMNWYADMGDPPDGLSQDRINNDGNYEPGNLRWTTASLQARNQRPRKRKARRANVADIRAYAAALAPTATPRRIIKQSAERWKISTATPRSSSTALPRSAGFHFAGPSSSRRRTRSAPAPRTCAAPTDCMRVRC
jgi:hypothetical protein